MKKIYLNDNLWKYVTAKGKNRYMVRKSFGGRKLAKVFNNLKAAQGLRKELKGCMSYDAAKSVINAFKG